MVSNQWVNHSCHGVSGGGDLNVSKQDELALTSAISDQFATFLASLESLFYMTEYSAHHVLVLDRFDECLENCAEFISAFAKVRECSAVQNLTVVVVMSSGVPRQCVTLTNPTIEFKPYSEDQVVRIFQDGQLCELKMMQEEGDGKEKQVMTTELQKREFYNQYVKFVVDSYYSYTGSNMIMLRHLIVSLWDRFIEPLRLGLYSIHEVVKVFKHNIDLFTNDKIISNSSIPDYKTLHDDDENQEQEDGANGINGGVAVGEGGEEKVGLGNVQDLPYHSKFILLAAYLASYGNQRNDLHKYSKVKVVKYKKRASRKPKLNNGSSLHLSKDDIDSRMLTANYVDLERILAILSVIYQHSSVTLNQSDKHDLLYLGDEIVDLENKKQVEKSNFTLTQNIDLNLQIATLYSLGFLSKTNNSDILAARIRWKCNLDWNMAEAIAKSVNFPISDFLDDD
ncbi:hypothetical protein CANMA_000247 [Candida margitis]|uniref:uncharacterized protein n=1 Tax=Candida margitis TaxID=1775924 RepID=UPI002226B24D|nr:uncharacterized protein CANMA_000247 [Candida margitis]KAI5970656.1 hypothetical protein CANMA_000247 [Candida margitis]